MNIDRVARINRLAKRVDTNDVLDRLGVFTHAQAQWALEITDNTDLLLALWNRYPLLRSRIVDLMDRPAPVRVDIEELADEIIYWIDNREPFEDYEVVHDGEHLHAQPTSETTAGHVVILDTCELNGFGKWVAHQLRNELRVHVQDRITDGMPWTVHGGYDHE